MLRCRWKHTTASGWNSCRYITQPALSDERVQLNAAGQVQLKLKTPWRDDSARPARLVGKLKGSGRVAILYTSCVSPA